MDNGGERQRDLDIIFSTYVDTFQTTKNGNLIDEGFFACSLSLSLHHHPPNEFVIDCPDRYF